jgi:hypothetical protein
LGEKITSSGFMGHPCDETRSGRITRGVPNKLSPPLASSRGKFLLLQPLNSPAQCLLAGCWAAWGEPHPTGKLFNHEEIEAGKRHALIDMVKAHAASVKVILLLFSDREDILSSWRWTGAGCTASRPSLFDLREMRRASFSHSVQPGLACFVYYAPGGAAVWKIAYSS